jgi:hypothetical protein
VAREQRAARTYFKLRFRSGGQQIVRYIGDEHRAAAVANELADLQSETRLMRHLKSLTVSANQRLREGKKRLEPVLAAYGWAFHGLAIRRPRTRGAVVSGHPVLNDLVLE